MFFAPSKPAAVIVIAAGIVLAGQGCAGGSSTSSSSSGDDASTADCASIEQEIHDAAVKRGIDPSTACTSKDP